MRARLHLIRGLKLSVAALAATALASVAFASPASAATIAVTSTADSGPGSLRAAVQAAGSGDTIALPAGTITLTTGVVSLGAKALTITGAGARQTTIDGSHKSQILNTEAALTVTGVTLADGSASTAGGAIETDHPLTLSDDAFVANHAISNGGAIDDEGSLGGSGAPLTVDRTLFEGNTAKINGGALYLGALGPVAMSDSTFTGNSAEGESGVFAIYNATPYTTVTLVNDTMVGNSAPSGSGALWRSGSYQTVRYRNNVFAGNGPAGSANICEQGGSAHNISDGHNFLDVNDPECYLTASGDRTEAVVKLGTLGNHGGPTDTILPLPGSPLIDGGDNTSCPLLDQRHISRPFGAACDVGAVEITPPAATTGMATSVTASSATLNGVVDSRGLGGATWRFEWGPTSAYGNQTPGGTAAGLGAEGVANALSGLPASSTIHYRLLVSDSDGTSFGADQTLTTSTLPPPPPPPPPAPTLTGLTESPTRWAEGKGLARLKRKAKTPVGTTFGFTLNVAATVTFKFTRLVTGRRSGKKCVAPASKSRGKARCTRAVNAGSLPVVAHAGANKLSFQGRLSAKKRLPPGRYTAIVTATNAAGSSAPQKLNFTIVKK